MTTTVDWSELQTELLNLISQRINNEIDLIRFRSVCSNWRSSCIPNHFNISPFKVPLLKHPFNNNNVTIPVFSCHLTKRSFFLVKPPQQENQEQQTLRTWLIRSTQTSTGTTKLSQCDFLSTDDSWRFPFDVLDFNNLSVLHLGCEFLVEDSRPSVSNCMLPKTVSVVTCHGKKPLTLIMLRKHPFMLLFRCSDGNCFLLPDVISTNVHYICVFKQRIYAVCRNGRMVTVGFEEYPNIQLAAEPLIDSGNIKFLVVSEGDLLLVDIYHHDIELRIYVFRLDEKERKWVKFENLGDKVLFIGSEYTFSASVSDLCVPKGNCIIFIDEIFFEHRLSIIHLNQHGQLWPLSDYPEYYNLFWPTPEWIVKSQLH